MMRDFERALGDIAALRAQMARSSEFRGFGPTTLATTGALAVIAALLQAKYIPDPASHVTGYLSLWVATAAVSMSLIAVEALTRSRRVHSGLASEMIFLALEQLLPAIVAGVLLTWVMLRSASESLWMLPGLWQIFVSLGVFASSRSVPRPMIAVGIWYMGTGLACIGFAFADNALSPLAMGIPFGFGQLLAAALIRYLVERDEKNGKKPG